MVNDKDKVVDDKQDKIKDDDKDKITLFVNGRPKIVTKNELKYDEVLELAFNPIPTGPYILITISYKDAAGRPTEGILRPDGSVKVHDGTTFDVDATDNS